jgi:hypothetical protein
MDMIVLIRRFTIITLLAAIFAMSFAALVVHPQRSFQRVHVGSLAPCYHPATPSCVALV